MWSIFMAPPLGAGIRRTVSHALKPYNFKLTLSQALLREMEFEVAANKASALEWPMPQLSISEVARQVGLRPSAIRYYEQIGLLPPAQRLGKAETLRPDNTVSAGYHSAGTATRFYFRRNPTVILRLQHGHSGFGSVAEALPTKARGTRESDARHKGSPATLEKDDAELLLRNAGSMWQGDISQRLWRPRREISACESSIWCKCPIICIEI